MTDELQQERTRLTNRMREQLRRYYPQMLELGSDIDGAWFLELWEKAPTPADAARIRKASIAAILKRNRIRRHEGASSRMNTGAYGTGMPSAQTDTQFQPCSSLLSLSATCSHPFHRPHTPGSPASLMPT